jgi:excisionase family DNA binding protein
MGTATPVERWSLGACRRCALKPSEHSYSGVPHGRPRLFTVRQAAEYLGCSERQVREEISEGKITYRRPPGGIRFTEEDLLVRLAPVGGPSAKKPRKNHKAVADVQDRTRSENEANVIGLAGKPFGMGSGSTVYFRFFNDHAEINGPNITSTSNF